MMGIMQWLRKPDKKKVEAEVSIEKGNPEKKSKKRKTLVKDFSSIVEEGNLQKLQEVFERCEMNAYDTFTKNNALSYRGLSDEAVKWLVEQGTDINYVGRWEKTPLHYQASYRNSNLRLFLSLGADVGAKDYKGQTPLHYAAWSFLPDNVRVLLDAGANIKVKDGMGHTALEEMLFRADGGHIPEIVEISKMLLRKRDLFDEDIKKQIRKIGENIEFYRRDIDSYDDAVKPDILRRDQALQELYQLYKVDPVPTRVTLEVGDTIVLKSKNITQQHDELWRLLVPGSGAAKTLQGEVIRIAGKLSYELCHNGGMNWDMEYRKLVIALKSYLREGEKLTEAEYQEVDEILSACTKGQGEAGMERLCALCVQWVLRNPKLVALKTPDYQR